MSGEVRIPVSLKFDVNSSIWQDTVSELRSSRMLSTIILLLLELYHDNDDVRQMIDSRAVIDSHVDFEALSKQLERISNSHKEALVATGLLRGTVSTSYSELDSKVSMLGTKLDAVLSVIQGLGGISFSSVAQVGQGALLGSGVGGSSTDGSEAVLGASGGISGGVSPMASGLVLSDGSLDGSLGGGGVFDGVSVASGGVSPVASGSVLSDGSFVDVGASDGVSVASGGAVSASAVSVGGINTEGSGVVLGASGVVSGGCHGSVSASQWGTDSVFVGDEGSDSGEDGDDEGVFSGAALASMQKLLGSLRK